MTACQHSRGVGGGGKRPFLPPAVGSRQRRRRPKREPVVGFPAHRHAPQRHVAALLVPLAPALETGPASPLHRALAGDQEVHHADPDLGALLASCMRFSGLIARDFCLPLLGVPGARAVKEVGAGSLWALHRASAAARALGCHAVFLYARFGAAPGATSIVTRGAAREMDNPPGDGKLRAPLWSAPWQWIGG